MNAGFVSIEPACDSAPSSPASFCSNPRRPAKTKGRWQYAVLRGDILSFYARRVDIKFRVPSVHELHIDLTPRFETNSFSFDSECLYVRCRHTQKSFTVRLHDRGQVQSWVTALYYQSLNADTSPRTRKLKSVSFTERPPEIAHSPSHEVNKEELYYTKREYKEFLRLWRQEHARRIR